MQNTCENPSTDVLYMKNWYLKNECIQIFCDVSQKVEGILHSKHCEEVTHCNEYPTNMTQGVTVKDINGIIHTHAEQNMSPDTVFWDKVNFNIYIEDHICVAGSES